MPTAPVDWFAAVGMTLAIEAAVMTFALALGVVLLRFLRLLDQQPASGRSSGGDPGPGGGRGGSRPGGPSGGGGTPAWWPAFERDLAAWAAARSPSSTRSRGASTTA
jgi:uncharacterized membrane protein YgcG